MGDWKEDAYNRGRLNELAKLDIQIAKKYREIEGLWFEWERVAYLTREE